VTTSSVLALSC